MMGARFSHSKEAPARVSDPYSPSMHALSKLHQSGVSASNQQSSRSFLTASNRATQGLSNGSASYDEAVGGDALHFSEDAGENADNLVDGLASWFGEMAGGTLNTNLTPPKSTGPSMSEDEKSKLKHGLSTMEKLAGHERRTGGSSPANHRMSLPQPDYSQMLQPGINFTL